MSPSPLFIVMKKKETSKHSDLTDPIDSILLPMSKNSTKVKMEEDCKTLKRKSSTEECPLPNKKKTSKDNVNSCNNTIQPTISSKTSEVVSTLKEKDFSPFWNQYIQEMSKKLWLCTRTDSQDSDPNWLNGSLKKENVNSWFTPITTETNKTEMQNFQRTSSLSLPTLLQDIMERELQRIAEEEEKKAIQKEKRKIAREKKYPKKEEETGKKKREKKIYGEMKAKVIQIYPTAHQKKILNKWFGTARWTYNRCVSSSKDGVKTMKALRALHIHNTLYEDENEWVTETPYEIRDYMLRQMTTSISTNNDKGIKYNMKYKSRKDYQQSINIIKKTYTRKKNDPYKFTFYKTFIGKNEYISSSEPVPEKLPFESVITKDRLNNYFLSIPQEVEKIDKPLKGIIALDPGVRTFCSGYDPSGKMIEWGVNDIQRIRRLCKHLDNLQSRWSSKDIRHKKRYKLQTAGRRLRLRIKNLIDDFHHKFANYLCDRYSIILLPKFETSKMVKKMTRNIGSKTARAMMGWSHYRFQQFLLNKSRERTNCKVIICGEYCSSITCGGCGKLHRNLGTNKTFDCPYCPYIADRDMNAARNIFLIHLNDLHTRVSRLNSGNIEDNLHSD